MKRVVETGFTGYFFRVLKEGMVDKDSTIELLERNSHKVSILYANHIYFHDRKNIAGIEKILEVKELAPVWRKKLEELLIRKN